MPGYRARRPAPDRGGARRPASRLRHSSQNTNVAGTSSRSSTARGPELGRSHHRRPAVRQDRPRPWPRRTVDSALRLLHEVATGALPRRRGPYRMVEEFAGTTRCRGQGAPTAPLTPDRSANPPAGTSPPTSHRAVAGSPPRRARPHRGGSAAGTRARHLRRARAGCRDAS